MRNASIILSGLSAALLVVACASSGDPVDNTTDKSPTEPQNSITAPPPANPPAPPPAPAKQCVSTCASDSDCQNSCPSVTNGIQCCDTSTGKCFASSQSTCPAPQDPNQTPSY